MNLSLYLFAICIFIASGCNVVKYELIAHNEDELTHQFEQKKGKMRPVEGYDSTWRSQDVVRPLLDYSCPILDRQFYTCNHGCRVNSVSLGKVRKIARIATLGIVVIIKSGEYITVYGGLDSVTVAEGDLIENGKLIGESSNTTKCFFEINRAIKTQNPSEWLKI